MGAASPEEQELDRRRQVLVLPRQGRGLIAHAMLTTDRILYGRQLFADTGRGPLVAAVERKVQQVYEGRSDGSQLLLELRDIRGIRPVHRRFRGDVYEFTLTDGSTCSLGASAGREWLARIVSLLRERHRLSVTDTGDGGWQVESP
jgi:hypothetical protein